MKLSRISLLVSSSFILLAPTTGAYAAALQLYELGTPNIGTAAVGQASSPFGASAAYFNPAAMVEIQSAEFMVGTQVILPYTNFRKNTSNTIRGDNGGNAAPLTPGAGIFYVQSLSPNWKFGLDFVTPYGGILNYDDNWVGRFVAQDVYLITVDLSPSIAYRFNNWFSLGAGFTVEYANLQEKIAIPTPLTPLVDGQLNLKMDDTALGFNVGTYFTPTETTKIGITYRSGINHKFSGDTTFLRIPFTPNTSTKMVMPQNVIASITQQVTNQFTLLGEVGWANWGSMKNTIVNIDGVTAVTIRDWNNTYRAGVAGQYYFTPKFLFQAGASYDSSPVSKSLRTPDLPMDRQIRIGTGIEYSVVSAVNVGFSYEYINFGQAPIDNHSSNGILAGHYTRNFANVVQASINVGC